MRILLLSPLFLLCTLQAQTTYYVDALGGDDLNAGTTRAGAFKSLTTAVTFLTDDDTLIVLPGTYSPSTTGEQYPIQIGDTGKSTTQHRVTIYGEGGPAVTIIDGEQMMTGAGTPILRFRWEADGSRITGFTFQNTGSSDFFSMCFRLGSTSGSNFATRNIEVYGNIFRNVHRAIVVFGTNPSSGPNQTHGIMIHDNLVVDTSHRPFAIFGDGQNFVYNNTIINPGHDGIWADDIFALASDTTIANNIIIGGSVHGIAVGSNGGSATVLNNNAMGNASGNYTGITASATNTSVDPMFVGGGDYHLQAASPLLESGTTANLPTISHDLERFPRLHDSNGDRTAGIDKGCYQRSEYAMVLTGDWKPGQGVTFTFGSPTPGLGVVYFSLGEGALAVNPFGVLLFDPNTLLTAAATNSPGALAVPIPNDPTLLGFRLVMQGAFLNLALNDGHLLNVQDRTF